MHVSECDFFLIISATKQVTAKAEALMKNLIDTDSKFASLSKSDEEFIFGIHERYVTALNKLQMKSIRCSVISAL